MLHPDVNQSVCLSVKCELNVNFHQVVMSLLAALVDTLDLVAEVTSDSASLATNGSAVLSSVGKLASALIKDTDTEHANNLAANTTGA